MTKTGWSETGYEAIALLLGVRAGLSFRQSQRATIEDAINRAMRRVEVSDTDAYLRMLKSDSTMLDDLLVHATVGETYFFRDTDQLDLIRKLVLPDICQRNNSKHQIRMWSAGCASGEEPYSLAMLLHQEGLLSRASILGSDISRESLKKARKGKYRNWSLRGTGKDLATPYLTQVDGSLQVQDQIRNSVHFEYLNLALENYPSTATATRRLDLILCRNVMIYFDRETIYSVVNRFHRCLVEGGWLVTGASDPPIHQFDLFEVVSTDHGMIFRKPAGDTWQRSAAGTVERPAQPARETEQVMPTQPLATLAVTTEGRMSKARRAMDRGDYRRAEKIASELPASTEASLIHIKALANRDLLQAEQACLTETQRHPLSKELHYLHAILLMDLNRHEDAAEALRRVHYLDRTLAIAHFSLGTVQRIEGNVEGAIRSFETVCNLLADRPSEDLVELGDGERVGDLLAFSRLQLETLQKVRGSSP